MGDEQDFFLLHLVRLTLASYYLRCTILYISTSYPVVIDASLPPLPTEMVHSCNIPVVVDPETVSLIFDR